MPMSRYVTPLALLCTGLLASPFAAATDLYSLKVSNDLFSSSEDGHYSSGVELSRTTLPEADHWSRRFADWLPGWQADDVDAVSYHLAHQIYTPNDIRRRHPRGDDRPYAGVLLGGVSFFADEEHDGWREASMLDLQLGWVGPAAGGAVLQDRVHKMTGSDDPRGWSHQLDNEPLLGVAGNKAWWWQDRLAGLEWEYGPSTSFQVGNLYDYVGGGGAIRFGEGLDKSFGIPSVAPALGGRQGFRAGGGFGWYGFLGVEGRYMAHNLLLDGNSFKDSPSVDRREWVGDLSAGAVISWDNWQIAFTSVWRTREFESQDSADHFGSITLSKWL
ncbi:MULTISPECIES: lipid A deacylase LpxR family protein [Modicisalibacter]|nr:MULTISPECIES: lipid A deacylase LpxR family protein [Modicisalibacter]